MAEASNGDVLLDDLSVVKATQVDYDNITGNFTLKEAFELSAEERFYRFGEVDCMVSPFVYGETIHSSICELLLYLK